MPPGAMDPAMNTTDWLADQPGRRPAGSKWWLLCLVICVWVTGCHRVPPPGSGDPRLPEAFRTPRATFRTWVEASLSGERDAVRACYWEDMPAEELEAWLRENLRPEARRYFRGARLVRIEPVNAVEVRFVFEARGGAAEGRGVMVRMRSGWKIQSW